MFNVVSFNILDILVVLLLQEEDLLKTFNKQVEEDRRIVITRSNLNEIHKVLR